MLSDVEMIARLFLAAVLGSLVGIERERLQWATGLRTHMLVCLGACLFMLVFLLSGTLKSFRDLVLDKSCLNHFGRQTCICGTRVAADDHGSLRPHVSF